MNQEVELAVAQLVPGSRKIEGRAGNFPQPQGIAIELPRSSEIGDGETDMMERLHLDHGWSKSTKIWVTFGLSCCMAGMDEA